MAPVSVVNGDKNETASKNCMKSYLLKSRNIVKDVKGITLRQRKEYESQNLTSISVYGCSKRAEVIPGHEIRK